jgi:hypothetical protein
MPPPGQCRVWYDGRPPGQQPAPTNCNTAERIASRDPYARVIYGDRVNQRNSPGTSSPYPRDRYPVEPYPGPYRGNGYNQVPFSNGYEDGYDKGIEDARDNDRFDPSRHSRYRSGDRGYNQRYGTRAEYRNVYRDGFRSGYEDGYRGASGNRSGQRPGGTRWPW